MKKVIALSIIFLLLLMYGFHTAAKEEKKSGGEIQQPKASQTPGMQSETEKAKVREPEALKRAREIKRKAGETVKESAGKTEEKVKEAEEAAAKAAKEKAAKKLGKEHEQQLVAFEKQLADEKIKHEGRVARLNRMRQLAVEKKDAKAIERIDLLLQKENGRFADTQKRIGEKISQIKEKMTEMGKLKEKTEKVKEVKVKELKEEPKANY